MTDARELLRHMTEAEWDMYVRNEKEHQSFFGCARIDERRRIVQRVLELQLLLDVKKDVND